MAAECAPCPPCRRELQSFDEILTGIQERITSIEDTLFSVDDKLIEVGSAIAEKAEDIKDTVVNKTVEIREDVTTSISEFYSSVVSTVTSLVWSLIYAILIFFGTLALIYLSLWVWTCVRKRLRRKVLKKYNDMKQGKEQQVEVAEVVKTEEEKPLMEDSKVQAFGYTGGVPRKRSAAVSFAQTTKNPYG